MFQTTVSMPLTHSQLPQAPAQDDLPTKERILSASKELFASDGFEKVSLRAITQAAEVNLASVNYHFGSKDALIDAVIEDVITPVNRERLKRLDTIEAACPENQAPLLREILHAFLVPLASVMRESELSEQLFAKLMGRCMSEPSYRLPESIVPMFQETLSRYDAAIARSRPQLSSELIVWRLYFTAGTLVQSLLHLDALSRFTEGRTGSLGTTELLNRILDFCIAGFDAPETTPPV
jgi:AcrR family transcriptional regulator